ncbi:MAG: helix-turn-helix domain-containing protein [Defluviitaleaceae bacterium]|nr:helix-turn-helix domain-containing protein [Defluviitaleaceae bacterium]
MHRLKELREQHRLNQEKLAIKLNVSQSTISAYEVGERTPDLETLKSIASLFDVSMDYLVGISEKKKNINHSDLSPDELDYINKYRQASLMDKEKIKAYMEGLLSK